MSRLLAPEGIFTLWLAVLDMALFITMGSDKRRAQKGLRRVPEARLFLLALLGGALGGWLGMYAFRHKTKHKKFLLGFPLLAAVQLAAWVYLWSIAAVPI